MTLLRYLLIFTGIGLLAGAMTILVWDLYQILKCEEKLAGGSPTRHSLVHFSSAGYAVRTSLAGGPEHRGGAQRHGPGCG